MALHPLVTMVSYIALLLLIMPATKIGILETALLAVLGLALMAWKRPWGKKPARSMPVFLLAAASVVYFGFCFYHRWAQESRIRWITTALPVSAAVAQALLVVAAVCGCVCAMYFVFAVLQQMKNILLGLNKNRLFERNLFCCLIAAIATVCIAQLMCNADVLSMGYLKFVWGILIVSVVILALYCLTGRIKCSIVLGTGLFMLISTVNVYVYQFRGRLFEPVDIFSFGTAMNVADNYSFFPIPYTIIVGWMLWCGLLAGVFRLYLQTKYNLPGKRRALLAAGCIAGVVAIVLYCGNLETYHWQKQGATRNGYVLDFVAKVKEAYVPKPNGYSEQAIADLADRYTQNTDASGSEAQRPHMIVIMDEAFSDLSVMGELTTNTEVMPFISSLKQNVISGYALASVYGGNTANSEYEFLTGNSMAWLSPNAVPYQQYLKTPAYSMVSYLKSVYNYQCIAMHPYLSNGWNRPQAYGNLGFDELLFAEDFPNEHFIRQYISDREMFETIVDVYENRQKDPLFLFGVTIQNHGGYLYSEDNFEQTVSLVGLDGQYSEAEQYLSLIHETDKAVEYLISYFQEAEDDVVIVFFGDHQPALDEEFYEEIAGEDADSLNAQQNRYQVPFFIWANYDLEEKYVECTGLNYLSSYVYEAAGLSLPPYNQFLSEMEENIPAINANGFYSLKAQCYLPFDEASQEEKVWLQAYEQLQYNSIFDQKHRNEKLFPVLQ